MAIPVLYENSLIFGFYLRDSYEKITFLAKNDNFLVK